MALCDIEVYKVDNRYIRASVDACAGLGNVMRITGLTDGWIYVLPS